MGSEAISGRYGGRLVARESCGVGNEVTIQDGGGDFDRLVARESREMGKKVIPRGGGGGGGGCGVSMMAVHCGGPGLKDPWTHAAMRAYVLF